MKIQKIAVLPLCIVMLLSGCSLREKMHPQLALPENAQSISTKYDEDTGETFYYVNGKTYSLFGRLNGKVSDDSIRDCYGYVEGDKDTRVYSLYEDPYDNYLMVRHVGGIMDQPEFLRAVDTKRTSIFTPEYIESAEMECWSSSGVYYEMATATIGVICEPDNIVLIDFSYKFNGVDAGGGETGYLGGDPIEPGDPMYVEINEVCLNGKVDKDEPFLVTVTFTITDTDGNVHEVEGEYEREMMLGAELNDLYIKYDEDRGYYLWEDL